MDCNNLHLKPYVRISPENTEPDRDAPKEDQAIRPYMNHRPDMCIDENSNGSEVARDLGDVESHTRMLEENAENSGRVENSTYTVVMIRAKSVSCGIVIVGDEVLYGNCLHHEFVDEKIILEKPGEAHLERRLEAEILEKVGIISNESHKLIEETAAERPNRKDSEAHLIRLQLQSLEAELLNKLTKSVLKVSGKRQRRKKLSDLLGAFDTFHFVNLAPLSLTVFPVSRQNIVLGQGSSEQEQPSSSEPPGEQRPWPPDFIYDRPWADFSHEFHRLGTFVNLPSDFPVFVLSLAQAGFICLPDGAIVCYFCRAHRDQWNTGDSPMEVHKQLNSRCPLVTGLDCNNVPVVTLTAEQLHTAMETWSLSGPSLSGTGRDPGGQASATTEGNASSLAPVVSSSENLSTLHQATGAGAQVSGLAPGQASAASVAVSGQARAANTSSSLAKQNVTVPSSQGGGNAGGSQTSQNSDTNNAQTSNQQQPTTGAAGRASSDSNPSSAVTGRAAHVFEGTAQPEVPGSAARGSGARPAPPASGEGSGGQTVTYQQLGITTDLPKRPDMATVNARLGSFGSWPSTHAQTPEALAEAGFYYAGYADCGRCFQCGGGLKNWVATDNPWVEHARWFNKCQYIKQNHGQDFIDIVSELNRQGETERPEISMEQVTEEMRNRCIGWYHEPALDPAIIAARGIGYSQGAVETAAQRLQTEGYTLTADRLLDYLEAEGATLTGVVENLGEAAGNLTDSVEARVTENSEIRQRLVCKICLDREVSLVFLPCGHLVCCASCSPALRTCPVCRQRIKGRVRAFPAN